MMFSVYLAGPIQNVTHKEATAWRRRFAKQLEGIGVWAFDPMRNKEPGMNYSDADIAERDFDDIDNADVVLLYCKQGVPMEGSSCEIGYCRAYSIPIVSVGRSSCSLVRDTVRKQGIEVESLEQALLIIKALKEIKEKILELGLTNIILCSNIIIG